MLHLVLEVLLVVVVGGLAVWSLLVLLLLRGIHVLVLWVEVLRRVGSCREVVDGFLDYRRGTTRGALLVGFRDFVGAAAH